MLNSGKKINILTLVLSEKKFGTKQTHNPPFKLNGRSLMYSLFARDYILD
jgi:hypothetical protein